MEVDLIFKIAAVEARRLFQAAKEEMALRALDDPTVDSALSESDLRPLDGGRAAEALVCWLAGPAAGERMTRVLGAMTAAGISLVLAALMWYSGGSLWLLPPLVGALFAGGKELFGT